MSDAKLPMGWQHCQLPDFTRIVMGQSPPSETYNHEGRGLPFFQGKAEFTELHPEVRKYCSDPNKIAEAGATLLTVRAPVGPTNLADRKCCIGRGLAAIHPLEDVPEKFVLYLFRAREGEISGAGTGTTFSAINGQFLEDLEVPLPPLAEQRRIVGKVEELFSELDEGVANLKQARAQLAVYRQALLKHAFEGHLTAAWRTKHAPELESADQLLARIRAEREERYQKQLKDWKLAKTKGRECSKPRELTPWAELSVSEPADLPPLPAGWAWIPFSNLCQVIRNGISAKPTGDTGDKILRISAVRPMKIDLNDFRYIQGADDEYEDYALKVGDLLFTRYNGSRKFVGVCGHFRGTERRLFPDKLIQGRLGVEAVLPEFVEAAFSCGASRKFVESRIRTTAGQAGVSGGDIKAVPVPVCSLAEQKEIVRFLEESLPNIDALEADIDLNLQKAEALRQSILKKAFAGELVPQDPSDEPAAALLARIRAEREAQPVNRRGRR